MITLDDIQYWKFDTDKALSYRGNAFSYGEVYWIVQLKNEYAVRNNYSQEQHLESMHLDLWRLFINRYTESTIKEYFTRVL